MASTSNKNSNIILVNVKFKNGVEMLVNAANIIRNDNDEMLFWSPDADERFNLFEKSLKKFFKFDPGFHKEKGLYACESTTKRKRENKMSTIPPKLSKVTPNQNQSVIVSEINKQSMELANSNTSTNNMCNKCIKYKKICETQLKIINDYKKKQKDIDEKEKENASLLFRNHYYY